VKSKYCCARGWVLHQIFELQRQLEQGSNNQWPFRRAMELHQTCCRRDQLPTSAKELRYNSANRLR